MLPRLLESENEHDFVWGGPQLSGQCFEELWGFEPLKALI